MRLLLLPIIGALFISAPVFGDQNVVIFLHNAWFEKNKDGQPHKKFGAYAFNDIKQALVQGGKVIAPERGPNADPKAAAVVLTQEVERLIESGHKAETIKVIGASKGAFIAQIASEKPNDTELSRRSLTQVAPESAILASFAAHAVLPLAGD